MGKLKRSKHYTIFLMAVLFALVITVYIAFALIAPPVAESETIGAIEGKYKYAIDIGENDGEFTQMFISGAQKAAEEYDIVLEIAGYNSSHRVGGQDFIEMAYMARMDAVITMGIKGASPQNLSATYEDKHKKMLFTYYEPSKDEQLLYVGPDNYSMGLEIANEIILSSAKEEINVVIVGSEKDHELMLAHGVKEIADQSGQINILETIKVKDSQLSAMDVAVESILEYDDVDYFICSNEFITLGVARGIVDINKVGESKVVGVGTSSELERYIDRNIVGFLIDVDAFSMGYEAVSKCYQAEEDEVNRWYIQGTSVKS